MAIPIIILSDRSALKKPIAKIEKKDKKDKKEGRVRRTDQMRPELLIISTISVVGQCLL